MSQHLPFDGFRWLTREEIDKLMEDGTWRNAPNDKEDTCRETGYIFDVDLHYPKHLHFDHNSLPLCAESIQLDYEKLSPWAKKVLADLKKPARHKARKLTATFEDKSHYVCHAKNLDFYLTQGLELIRVHRVLAFRQRPFMRNYIRKCTDNRKKAATSAENKMWKSLCNFLYGKMIENPENRMDCHFIRNDLQAEKRFSDPTMKSAVICSENLAITFHKKKELEMKQSWAVGFSILELAKLHMLKLYYEHIQPKFKDNVSILASDTDSFILLVRTNYGGGLNEIFEQLRDVMDFSNLPPNHLFFDPSRKNELGFLKLEFDVNRPIIGFAGLKSKSYCIRTMDGNIDSRAKGIRTPFKQKLTFADYKRTILFNEEKRIEQISFLTSNHITHLVKTNKTCFTSFDDKRFALCPVHSVPYGSIEAKRVKKRHEYIKDKARARGQDPEKEIPTFELFPCIFCKMNMFDRRLV